MNGNVHTNLHPFKFVNRRREVSQRDRRVESDKANERAHIRRRLHTNAGMHGKTKTRHRQVRRVNAH